MAESPVTTAAESPEHAALRLQLQKIMNSYGKKEPNIPFTHEYWFLQNQLKWMDRTGK